MTDSAVLDRFRTDRPQQSVHRDKITLSDVMGHPLVQPLRHATSLGKPTRNPSYLPSSVFARTLIDVLAPTSMEPEFADIERGARALENSSKLQQSLSSILKASKGEVESFLTGTQLGASFRYRLLCRISTPRNTGHPPGPGS